MSDTNRQNGATLIAVWPGMGQVALNAGFYLMSRLHMEASDVVQAGDLFDVEHIDVQGGLVSKAPPPQGRMFLWKNPKTQHDVAVFIGESQPPPGRNAAYCERLLDAAQRLGVRQVYTFASMATDMLPSSPSRVVGIATDASGLATLKRHDISVLEAGRISGLNGVFLALAAERGLPGIGLLGEIPAMAAQIPYPKATRTVLETFAALSGIEIDLRELIQHEKTVDLQLTGIVSKLKKAMEAQGAEEEPEFETETEPEAGLTAADRARIEELFAEARKEKSRSFVLKQELDRLSVFKEYEDRFLDLFRKAS